MRVPEEGRALRPPTLGWLLRVWIDLEELLCDFSLKPFVGPSPTPQSHHGWCSSADGPSTVPVLRGDGNSYYTTRHGPQSNHVRLAVSVYGASKNCEKAKEFACEPASDAVSSAKGAPQGK